MTGTVFLIFAMLFTYYITAADKIMGKYIPDSFCPSYYPEEDASKPDYKKLAFEDFQKPYSEQNSLMGCYCKRHTSILQPWTLF